MRIVAYVNKDSGAGYHRIMLPLLLMEDVDVFVTNNLLEEHFEGCDVFMYNRMLPDHADAKVRELKEKHGFKICVDVDDYWELDDRHILFEHYKENNITEQLVKHIRAADIIMTTHSRLANEIIPLNKNVHVCPNAIPKAGQFLIEKEPYHLTRLFWQGSVTHLDDISILQTPIDRLAPIAKKIKMVLAGWQEQEEHWHQMANIYTAGFKHQYSIQQGKPVTEYYSLYKHADICLVPLVNTMFNRMKSNLKVLEAANLGLPVIASNVHPYKDLPVLYARNSEDWIKHVKRLVASKKRQKEAGQELQEYCEQHFNFTKINRARKHILEYEVSKVNA